MIHELQLRVLPQTAASIDALREHIAQENGISISSMNAVRILKRSIDARQRTIFVNLKVRVYENEQPTDTSFPATEYKPVDSSKTAIVVGAGPAGLFAALRLIELGIKPIVVERGKNVRERKVDLAQITKKQAIDPESNYCFGEGGAGAYSDGKLYTRSKKRGNVDKILNVLCQHGADEAILVDAHPHIGTDKLPRVIENIRQTILDCGGEVRFASRMDKIILRNNRCEGIALSSGEELYGQVILATGHSARDVYRWLDENQVKIEAKGIAVGVRLEHPQHLIDCIQYHSRKGRGEFLPPAEYNFVTQVEGRGVYSFCMCPGGFIVPAASGPEQVVVNGMSPSNRGSQWANSGIVVEVRPEDVPGYLKNAPLCVMRFQEEVERVGWLQGGMKQTAPAQRMADFINGRLSAELPESSYAPGLVASPLHFFMPKFISSRLRQGLLNFGRSARGFITNHANLIGMETRTSSPVRILRDENLQHVQIEGLFPCGEGAGYAGGIVSAAIDGERCAENLAAMLTATH